MRFIIAFLAFFITIHSFSQEKEQTLTLVPKAHFRTFWMSTSYPSDFKNDFALGSSLNLGGELSYQDRLKIQLGYFFLQFGVAHKVIHGLDSIQGGIAGRT